MNLIFTLLSTRQYLSKEQLRQAIADYRDSTQQAFERKFERDKEELRELGITVETGSNDKYFDDEPGYRIRRDAVELPDLALSREEAAVLGLAAQVWEHAGLAQDSMSALVKLKAAGVTIDTDVVRMAEPKLSANEPAFDAAWDACTRRVPVAFDYRRPGKDPSRRHVQPWGIVSWRGRWYLSGHDTDRDAPRVFRLSRVVGEIVPDGAPGSYEVPDDADVQATAASFLPSSPDRSAVLRIRRDRGQGLRRSAESTRAVSDDLDEVVVPYASGWDLAAEIASYGPDVVVLEPSDLREAVVDRLRAAVQDAS